MSVRHNLVHITVGLVIFLMGAALTGAQPRSGCPTISVTGPAGIIMPGDWMEFIGELSGDRPRDVTYQWTLADEGKILEGQGTLRLKVQTPKKAESNLTATLTVQGLPIGCTSSASVTAPVVCWCDPLLVDEFGPLRRREHIARIDTAVVELRKRPQSKLLFIEYFPRKTARLTVNARLRWLTDQLDRRNRVPTRDFEIIASDSLDSVRRTKIYIVAPGAENPVP